MELTEIELATIVDVFDEHIDRLTEAIYKEGAYDMLADAANLYELKEKLDGERQRVVNARRKAL